MAGTEKWRKVSHSYMDIFISNVFQMVELIELKLFVIAAKMNFINTGVL